MHLITTKILEWLYALGFMYIIIEDNVCIQISSSYESFYYWLHLCL